MSNKLLDKKWKRACYASVGFAAAPVPSLVYNVVTHDTTGIVLSTGLSALFLAATLYSLDKAHDVGLATIRSECE